MNETPSTFAPKKGWKRVVALSVAAVAVVGLTGVGAVATSTTGIYNNQFVKDAVPAGFTFTGTPFLAHYNKGSKSAEASWTATNASATDTASWDGIFALKTPTDLPLALAQHLEVFYNLQSSWGAWSGNGGTLAKPIDLVTAIGINPIGSIIQPPNTTEHLTVKVTWDGTDPAPAQAIDAIADFQVSYSMGNAIHR